MKLDYRESVIARLAAAEKLFAAVEEHGKHCRQMLLLEGAMSEYRAARLGGGEAEPSPLRHNDDTSASAQRLRRPSDGDLISRLANVLRAALQIVRQEDHEFRPWHLGAERALEMVDEDMLDEADCPVVHLDVGQGRTACGRRFTNHLNITGLKLHYFEVRPGDKFRLCKKCEATAANHRRSK